MLLLLLGFAVWGRSVCDPKLLVDLTGTWSACPAPEGGGAQAACLWRDVQVPAPFTPHADDVFDNHLRYRKSFKAPRLCFEHTCKLIFGEVGDSASLSLNGTLLRQSAPPGSRPVYEKNYPVGIDLPPSLLHAEGEENELIVTVFSFRDQQVGLRAGPVAITTNEAGIAFLRWRSFKNVFLPLACSIVGAVIMLVVGFLRRSGVPDALWRAFYRYATASTLFMFSFSEIPRQLAPLVYVAPAHFLLRFYTDYSLLALLRAWFGVKPTRAWRVVSAFYIMCFAVFAALLLIALYAAVTGAPRLDASTTFSVVLHLYPLTTAGPLLIGVAAIGDKKPLFAASTLTAAGVVLHEWAIGSGFYEGDFVSKYVHLLVVVAFLIALVQRAAREQAHELATLAAQQMDHDIRSPLSALDVAVRQLDTVPEDVRVLIRMAVDRIRDIANSIRKRDPEPAVQAPAGGQQVESLLLASVVDAVVSEKRMQFSEHLHLEIEQQWDAQAYDLFVRGEAGALKRVLSNLLNNAAEAMNMAGHVLVVVKADAGGAQVSICDGGPGMPADVLARLGEKGLTQGKAHGSGLGIHHAMCTLKAWGAHLRFAVPPEGGTQVTVELPRCEAPAWFAKAVPLRPRQTVVILDDDRAVHAAWRERLQSIDVVLVHVSSQAQLVRWVAEEPGIPVTFFVDFELGPDGKSGLDTVIELGLQEHAYLVTSHFETESVLRQCMAHGVRVIPKSLVDIVPLGATADVCAA